MPVHDPVGDVLLVVGPGVCEGSAEMLPEAACGAADPTFRWQRS